MRQPAPCPLYSFSLLTTRRQLFCVLRLCVQPDGNCCQSLLVLFVTWQAPGPSTLPHKVLARARPRVTTCAARICSCQAPGRGWLAEVLTQVPVPGVASRRELAGCYHLRESERETSSSQQPAAAPHHPNLHFPPRKDPNS